jgi:hypothetical protein
MNIHNFNHENIKPKLVHAKYIKPNSIIAINVTDCDMEFNNNLNRVIINLETLIENENQTRKKCPYCAIIIPTIGTIIIFVLVYFSIKS